MLNGMPALSLVFRALVLAAVISLISFSAQAIEFTGAGGSFPASAYQSWGTAYRAETGNSLDYQVTGSAGGQSRALNRSVDFGASDVPMPAEKLAEGQLFQFPALIGAVVIMVNLDGVKSNELNLTGPIIANIYLGLITNWNDPAIAALNPDQKLPDLAITPVHRSDPSGTTFVFTSYMSKSFEVWNSLMGAGTEVKWLTGVGGISNSGVADAVKSTKGAIGYVEYTFAASWDPDITMVRLRNGSGDFVTPARSAFKAAAEEAAWDSTANFAPPMIDTRARDGWPIVSATFILLPKNPKDASRSHEVMRFFNWAFASGDGQAHNLGYVTLPEHVKERIRQAWRAEIKDASGSGIWKE